MHALGPQPDWRTTAMKRRRVAWILILIVDVGFVLWGAMAAALPDYLLGTGGRPILTAGYEGFSRGTWSELAGTAPMTARYIGVLFRMYGVFNVTFDQEGEKRDPWWGDPSFRAIPLGTTEKDVRLYHMHIDPRFGESDFDLVR